MKATLVKSPGDLPGLFSFLVEPRRVLAIDIESDSLMAPHANRVRLVQFGDADAGWAVPFDGYEDALRDIFRRIWGKQKILHNAGFDVPQLCYHLGISWDWKHTDDTMIAAKIRWPNQSAALKTLTTRHIHAGAASGQKKLDAVMKKNKWTWQTIPIDTPEYWQYGVLDTILTARLWEFPDIQEVIIGAGR